MTLDLYAPCPCGSGKKFKWCCQPIHVQITKAMEQDRDGQHDAALRLLDEVVAAHSDNPEAWGRKAQLLYQNDKVEEAEVALTRALELNPRYAFGHFLRGRFRHFENEIRGALLQYRKAADMYDPQAGPQLSIVYGLTAECELVLNNPVACRAALEIALRIDPANQALAELLENELGEKSGLPLSARRSYQLQTLRGATPQRQAAWEQALAKAATGRLADAVAAFEQLAGAEGAEAAAWFNLGLTRAWLGQNSAALEALDRYLALESDESLAAASWALAEVLRCGQGLEDQADFVEHHFMGIIKDGAAFGRFIQDLFNQRRFIPSQKSLEERHQTIGGLILERLPDLTPELAARRCPHVAAKVMIAGNVIHLGNTHKEALDQLVAEMQQQVGSALADVKTVRSPAIFANLLSEALVFPAYVDSDDDADERVQTSMAEFFEVTWLHRPLHSLGLVPPVDAAGHPVLRKKLLGILQFYQECLQLMDQPFDFGPLKHKLGLVVDGGAKVDVAAMSAPELAALEVSQLPDDQVELAFQTSVRLDAQELASRFAQAMVSRPPRAERPDRYLWHNHLIQRALSEGNQDASLDYLNAGEKDDCDNNQGRRRHDYELRRGQIHLRRGEIDLSQEVFDRLIACAPDELRFRGSAAEAMLSAQQGARALRFAEEGLAVARRLNNRDSEQHFLELLSAAKKKVQG